MTTESRGDVSPEEFRRTAHEVVDWIADYLEHPERYPVRSRVAPGEIRNRLEASPPAAPAELSGIFDDFKTQLMDGITHWNNPGFFAYIANTGSYPGVIGELLAAGLNVNGMLWATSPAVTELEEVSLSWLKQLIGLEGDWFGEITDTASVSTFYALAAARERCDPESRAKGLYGRADQPRLRVYCSDQAHSSVDKAVISLGIGHDNLVRVSVDENFRMRTDELARLMAADKEAGFSAMAVVATVGTTSTTSVDPVAEIVRIAAEYGAWVHVDGAYGAAAAVVPEMRYVIDGVSGADSLVINPHKWLFTQVDCSALYVRDSEALKRAFSLRPAYLTTKHQDKVVNLMDYGIQLGRRFRALKLWMVLRAFGSEGIAERLRYHCELARDLAGMVHYEGGWELMAPVNMSVVCFRYAPSGVSEDALDRINAEILERVNASGVAFLSHTQLNGRYSLRVAIGNIRTSGEHITSTWQVLREAARGSV